MDFLPWLRWKQSWGPEVEFGPKGRGCVQSNICVCVYAYTSSKFCVPTYLLISLGVPLLQVQGTNAAA